MKVGQGLVIHTFSKVRDVHVLLLDIRSDNTSGSCGLQYKLVEVPGALRNKGAGSYFSSLKGKGYLHTARTDGTIHSHFCPKDTIGEMSYSIVSGSDFCCSSPTIS